MSIFLLGAKPMGKLSLALLALLAAGSATSASNCDDIKLRIDAKIKASGAGGYTLDVVDANAKTAGKVVGSCDLGTRKIVYVAGDPAVRLGGGTPAVAAPAPVARSRNDRVLTECKAGYVVVDGDCKPG
jgi:hypothetical protein